jgi:hypothetical protein
MGPNYGPYTQLGLRGKLPGTPFEAGQRATGQHAQKVGSPPLHRGSTGLVCRTAVSADERISPWPLDRRLDLGRAYPEPPQNSLVVVHSHAVTLTGAHTLRALATQRSAVAEVPRPLACASARATGATRLAVRSLGPASLHSGRREEQAVGAPVKARVQA